MLSNNVSVCLEAGRCELRRLAYWIEELGLLTVLIARVVVAGYSLMSLSGLSPLMLWPHKISFRLTGSQQAILVIRSIPIIF